MDVAGKGLGLRKGPDPPFRDPPKASPHPSCVRGGQAGGGVLRKGAGKVPSAKACFLQLLRAGGVESGGGPQAWGRDGARAGGTVDPLFPGLLTLK